MMILELHPYNAHIHEPKTGWDEFFINAALENGKTLYVDQNGEVWTSGRREYVGKVA